MTAGPGLSIGMPVYDGENFVAESLNARPGRNCQEGRAS